MESNSEGRRNIGVLFYYLNTLIPGITPLSLRRTGNSFPSTVVWPSVSSNMITPEMYFSMSGVVNKSSL